MLIRIWELFLPVYWKKKSQRIAIHILSKVSFCFTSFNKADWETVPKYQYFIQKNEKKKTKILTCCYKKSSVHISYWFQDFVLYMDLMLVSKHQGFYKMDRTKPSLFIFQCARKMNIFIIIIILDFLLKQFLSDTWDKLLFFICISCSIIFYHFYVMWNFVPRYECCIWVMKTSNKVNIKVEKSKCGQYFYSGHSVYKYYTARIRMELNI